MKRYIKILALLMLPLLMIACKKDEHSMGEVLDKSAINFTVTQDLQADPGGNTVILKNLTPGTLSMWDYGTGTSNRMSDTVKFAFAGDYTIKFAVSTGGAIVTMDSVIVKVTADNLQYVNDPLWTALTGGVGNEKQWVLDEAGIFFAGPLSFYGTTNGWLKENEGCYGGDCWNWGPGTADIILL